MSDKMLSKQELRGQMFLLIKSLKLEKSIYVGGCGEKFEKGIGLHFVKSVDSGVISSSYWCRICDVAALEHHDWNDDGFPFTVVKDLDSWFDNSRHLPRTYLAF